VTSRVLYFRAKTDLNWLNKKHKLKWEKPQNLDFYADQIVLYAQMKICFVLNVDKVYEKKIELQRYYMNCKDRLFVNRPRAYFN